MKHLKKYKVFENLNDIQIHPLCKFTKDDLLDFQEEFQIIADGYNLNYIDDELNEMDGVNQYTIKASNVLYISMLIFINDDDNDRKPGYAPNNKFINNVDMIKEDLMSFATIMENLGWKLCDKHGQKPIIPIRSENYPSRSSDNYKISSFKELTIYFTK